MGGTQGIWQSATMEPTQEPTRRTTVELEFCSLCMSTYQRMRQSVCICTHCSLPLCSDCLREHIDEQPQNVSQLCQQLHDLQQLFETKKTMVQMEVSQSSAEIKQYVKTYQNNLSEAHHTIIVDIETTKQDAERYLSKIYSELQTIKVDIETLAQETIFQPNRMEALLTQLNQIQEKLETYEMTKDTDLQIVMPTYKIKFQCAPVSTTTDTTELSDFESANSQENSGRRPSRRNRHHPYEKKPGSDGKKEYIIS